MNKTIEESIASANLDTEEQKKKLNEYYVNKNYKSFVFSNDCSFEEVAAIRYLFKSKKPLLQRSEKALKLYPFCKEAMFIYSIFSEPIYAYLRMRSYYEKANEYADFSKRDKDNYLTILDYYADFLLNITNITESLDVQKIIIQFSKRINRPICSRLSYTYYLLENCDDFYRFFCEVENFPGEAYIMLIVTLLKHHDEFRAKEVLRDMLEKIPYAEYIDHIWDIDKDDEEQAIFYNTVDICYVEISSVPYFFSWCSKTKDSIIGVYEN